MDAKRSFTIVSASTKSKDKGSSNAGGRFESRTPAGAARKAGSQICRQSAIRGQCTLFITVQETTRGSANKLFKYKVKRVVVNNKIEHDGKLVNHKYLTTTKAVKL